MANTLVPKYYYFGDKPPKGRFTRLVKNSRKIHSVFNFEQSFIEELYSFSSLNLGLSVPYISLKTIDINGDIINDLNLDFFFHTPEYDQSINRQRYGERPPMSLQSLDVSTDNASGYHYYKDVVLKIKLHSFNELTNNSIIPLLIPDVPILLEYGWNSKDPIINDIKEKLVFQVVKYSLNIDVTNQVDLVIHGKAYTDFMFHAYVGDESTQRKFQGNIYKKHQDLQDKINYLKEIKKTKSNNFTVPPKLSKRYDSIESRARSGISKIFNQRLARAKEFTFKRRNVRNVKVRLIRFHDLIHSLCHETFQSVTSLFAGMTELKIIYGALNEYTGFFNEKSIADFPIRFRKFKDILKEKISNGEYVFTIQYLLNIIIDNFLNNQDYWKELGINVEANFQVPNVLVLFTNRNQIAELSFVDAYYNIPPTTKSFVQGKGSTESVKQNIRSKQPKFPIIELGRAKSFIRGTSLAIMNDEAMKTVLIKRSQPGGLDGVRGFYTPSKVKAIKDSDASPISLPFQGTLRVIGHTEWRPLRAFYLSAGCFLTDAVYVILAVKHTLNSQGFNTTIDIQYH